MCLGGGLFRVVAVRAKITLRVQVPNNQYTLPIINLDTYYPKITLNPKPSTLDPISPTILRLVLRG